jgi:hypothetical protein
MLLIYLAYFILALLTIWPLLSNRPLWPKQTRLLTFCLFCFLFPPLAWTTVAYFALPFRRRLLAKVLALGIALYLVLSLQGLFGSMIGWNNPPFAHAIMAVYWFCVPTGLLLSRTRSYA